MLITNILQNVNLIKYISRMPYVKKKTGNKQIKRKLCIYNIIEMLSRNKIKNYVKTAKFF